MAVTHVVERRRERRIELPSVAVAIRALGPKGASQSPLVGQAKDVSLSGVLAHMSSPVSLSPGTPVTCEVSVPRHARKQFPFSKLLGEGWIVRVNPHEGEAAGGSTDVAVAFAGNATALGTIEAY